MRWFSTLLAALSLVSALVQAASPRGPIIGVFAHPFARHGEYIAASYVKWVESAGGRVVPIPYSAPKEYLKELVPQLNGLLFPGGAANVNDRAEYMYQLALELNDQGVHYPVWGTCLGFEWLLQLTASDLDAVQGGFDSMNISMALNFTEDARQSRLFAQASDDLFLWIGERPLTMNNHMQGIATEHFAKTQKLTDFYTVLSTNVDRNNREFISTIEAKKYPIFAVQFHPEKNNFEYGEYDDGTPYEVIDHSYEAILMSQYFANFFINEARKNDLRFKDPKVEQAALIYNYQTYTVKYPGFVESYVFKHDAKQEYWSIM
ncbi:TPA: hypothetical protein N0F65_012229 [Lagenidium giganteum]|uniref:folate gamma-glutamyl hydrolase n=1 Tax=Lagenidium giganteum TaxID=4803 RepID=A0AAV2ZB40_9STRA|nr:TPA: hypothetical protein N0F65_012229 [Lagenidium giganteum]